MKILNYIPIYIFFHRVAHGLMKTCRPTFHEKLMSGGDEIKMRWEYCT